jgi:hypothetical protein
VAKQIVRYFLRNPTAADTLEGVARWRLRDEAIHQSIRITDAALRMLLEMRLLFADHTLSAGTLYHFDEARRRAAERFVGLPAGARRGRAKGATRKPPRTRA